MEFWTIATKTMLFKYTWPMCCTITFVVAFDLRTFVIGPSLPLFRNFKACLLLTYSELDLLCPSALKAIGLYRYFLSLKIIHTKEVAEQVKYYMKESLLYLTWLPALPFAFALHCKIWNKTEHFLNCYYIFCYFQTRCSRFVFNSILR